MTIGIETDMQMADVQARAQIPRGRLHSFIHKSRTVLPQRQGSQGESATYDMASVIAAIIGSQLVDLRIPVARFERAFAMLHASLRQRSPSEWRLQRLCLSPVEAIFEDRRAPFLPATATIGVDLGQLWDLYQAREVQVPAIEFVQVELNFGSHLARDEGT